MPAVHQLPRTGRFHLRLVQLVQRPLALDVVQVAPDACGQARQICRAQSRGLADHRTAYRHARNVGLELQEDGTSIDGSVKEAKVSNTSDPATVGATVLVNVTSAPVTITLNSTEDNTTVTNAAMTIQKLN